MDEERRNTQRRQFGYYMRVLDGSGTEQVGYLSDIGPRGIRMDTRKELVVNKNYNLRLDLTPEVSDRAFITFTVVIKWIHPDVTDPGSYNIGSEVIVISNHDEKIFNNILEKYGRPETLW